MWPAKQRRKYASYPPISIISLAHFELNLKDVRQNSDKKRSEHPNLLVITPRIVEYQNDKEYFQHVGANEKCSFLVMHRVPKSRFRSGSGYQKSVPGRFRVSHIGNRVFACGNRVPAGSHIMVNCNVNLT